MLESGKIFPTFWKIFQLFKKISFYPPKFLKISFSHSLRFSNYPSPFSQKRYISPSVSENLLFPPCFAKFSSDFVDLICFNMLYLFSFPPYFDHDAFMHHTMH